MTAELPPPTQAVALGAWRGGTKNGGRHDVVLGGQFPDIPPVS